MGAQAVAQLLTISPERFLTATLGAMDLPRFDSGSATHLSGLLFEGQGAFPSQS